MKKKSILYILAGLLIGYIFKLFIIDILHIKGTSMEPTFKDNSTVVVNKLAYGIVIPYSDKLLISWNEPKVGDVVIYLYNNKLVIKRVAATSKTLLEFSTKEEYNLIVGEKSYPLTQIQYNLMKDCKEVPEGTILAIGDNAELSIDSRNYGFISIKNVLGKVICK